MSRLNFDVTPDGPMVFDQGAWRRATLAECGAEIVRLNRKLNVRHSDRAAILREIDVVAPEDAPRIRLASYARLNPGAKISGAGAGNN